jgi:O-antigen/teichoic acid export membrane protein
MKKFSFALRAWGQDVLLKRVVRNSGYLFGSNVIGAVLSILTANMLGVESYGVLGVVTTLVSNINRLFSFRMGEVVVKNMGEFLANNERDRAAAIVKAAGLAEGLTSIAAYLVLAICAPLAARYIAKDLSVVPLFLIYGTTILGNITTETATGVLQVGNHYRSQAFINLAQSVLVAVLIVWAAFSKAGLWEVTLIYMAGKMVLGLGPIVVALYWLPRMLGRDWWRASFALLPPRRKLFRFAISTNFSGTINVVARDSENLWISYFFSPLEAGYFKVALALINLIVMPITPFISTTFPEITRTITLKQWPRLRSLLSRVTVIAAGWTAAVTVGLLALGQPLLFSNWSLFGRTFHIYKPEYAPAYPALLILLLGYGLANILFWNRTLLLALGQADYPLKIGFYSTLVKVVLTVLLVPHFGYLMEAALLSLYFITSVGLTVRRGLRDVSILERTSIEKASPSVGDAA